MLNRNNNPIFIVGASQQIPAFAGMTMYRGRLLFLTAPISSLIRSIVVRSGRFFSRDLSRNEYAGTTTTRLESKRPFVLSMSRNAAGNPPGQATAEPQTVPKKNPGLMQRSR